MYMNAAAHMNTCAVFHLKNIHVLNECQADRFYCIDITSVMFCNSAIQDKQLLSCFTSLTIKSG